MSLTTRKVTQPMTTRGRSLWQFFSKNLGGAVRLACLTLPRAIWLFCGWHSIRLPKGSEIVSATNVSGRHGKARQTATAERFGGWAPFSAEPRMTGSAELQAVCLSWPFLRQSNFEVPELAHSRC